MNNGIYSKEELFNDNFTIEDAYEAVKNGSWINSKIPFIKCVYDINKEHIGWLISSYHYISKIDVNQPSAEEIAGFLGSHQRSQVHKSQPLTQTSVQLYFTSGLNFYKKDDLILLDDEPKYYHKLDDTTFRVYVQDANSHDLIAYRSEHWLHKAGLDGFPLHIYMSCDCGLCYCQYNNNEFYYNSSESFVLIPFNKEGKKPLIKVILMVNIKDNMYK